MVTNTRKRKPFIDSFEKLIDFEGRKVTIEFYHHDYSSEPTAIAIDVVETVIQNDFNRTGLIIELDLKKSNFVFYEKNHITNISNNSVVFSSRNDNETYWIIWLEDEQHA